MAFLCVFFHLDVLVLILLKLYKSMKKREHLASLAQPTLSQHELVYEQFHDKTLLEYNEFHKIYASNYRVIDLL